MTDLIALCPKGETAWVGYYNKDRELLFFLTGPANMSSTFTAQSEAFILYAVTKGARKAKKLGAGGSPTELEKKYGVAEKIAG